MHWNASVILAVVAGGLAVLSLIKATWTPLIPVAALLLAVAVVLVASGVGK